MLFLNVEKLLLCIETQSLNLGNHNSIQFQICDIKIYLVMRYKYHEKITHLFIHFG